MGGDEGRDDAGVDRAVWHVGHAPLLVRREPVSSHVRLGWWLRGQEAAARGDHPGRAGRLAGGRGLRGRSVVWFYKPGEWTAHMEFVLVPVSSTCNNEGKSIGRGASTARTSIR
jgi:hypothetical protein